MRFIRKDPEVKDKGKCRNRKGLNAKSSGLTQTEEGLRLEWWNNRANTMKEEDI